MKQTTNEKLQAKYHAALEWIATQSLPHGDNGGFSLDSVEEVARFARNILCSSPDYSVEQAGNQIVKDRFKAQTRGRDHELLSHKEL